INLIHLGMLSRRIPITPPFMPSSSHLKGQGVVMGFDDIFDLPRLRETLQWPILQWSDVKKTRYNLSVDFGPASADGPQREAVGCWSLWQGLSRAKLPIWSSLPKFLNLDIMYTPVPRWIKMTDNVNDEHAIFGGIASLLMPQRRVEVLSTPESKDRYTYESSLNGTDIEPDEQLSCFDILYFVGSHVGFEWEHIFSPAWNLVGTATHFSPRLEALAVEYLRRLFSLQDGQAIPSFISVHIRRDDFQGACAPEWKLEECFASLDVYARRIKEVEAELAARSTSGTPPTEVVVTSDERNITWWAQVDKMGWKHIDHAKEESATKHGL
ncbi:hypothetical protein FRB99_003983, partial [Tulasnella sp. 403]